MEYAELGKKNSTKFHEDFSVTGIMSMRGQSALPGRIELRQFQIGRARFFSRKQSFKRSDLSKNRKKCHL